MRAHSGQLQVNDVIVGIDGRRVDGMDFERCTALCVCVCVCVLCVSLTIDGRRVDGMGF
jgi:hypothetical protein